MTKTDILQNQFSDSEKNRAVDRVLMAHAKLPTTVHYIYRGVNIRFGMHLREANNELKDLPLSLQDRHLRQSQNFLFWTSSRMCY